MKKTESCLLFLPYFSSSKAEILRCAQDAKGKRLHDFKILIKARDADPPTGGRHDNLRVLLAYSVLDNLNGISITS